MACPKKTNHREKPAKHGAQSLKGNIYKQKGHVSIMKTSRHQEADIVLKKENGAIVIEVKMSPKLRKEMEELANYTSGTIHAI